MELPLPAYATATATWDLSNLHHSSRQCRTLNPLSKARDWTCVLMDASGSLTIEPQEECQFSLFFWLAFLMRMFKTLWLVVWPRSLFFLSVLMLPGGLKIMYIKHSVQEFPCGSVGWGPSVVTVGVGLFPGLGNSTCCECGQANKQIQSNGWCDVGNCYELTNEEEKGVEFWKYTF